MTTAQYNSNQQFLRMQKAFKNQTTHMNTANKKYVDLNVNVALAEADRDFCLSRSHLETEFDEVTF